MSENRVAVVTATPSPYIEHVKLREAETERKVKTEMKNESTKLETPPTENQPAPEGAAVRKSKKGRVLPFPERFTVEEVAEALRISPPTLRAKCARREISFLREGKLILFTLDGVNEYDKQCRRPVPAKRSHS